jgi:hypothetical protein
MTTFDPGAMSGDATLVDLTTTKVLGCVPWRMAVPRKSIPLDKSDPKKDLLIQERALARCGVHRAMVGAGASPPFEYDCKNAD